MSPESAAFSEVQTRRMAPTAGETMLSTSERCVLGVFRQFRVSPGEMLCFYGPNLKKHKPALRQLMEKEMVVAEKFNGGYSLTRAGFEAMRDCQ